MLITQAIEVDQPIDAVWNFFYDIPQVAACLPGANLTNDMGNDTFEGDVIIKAGPVKLEFAGSLQITKRDEAKKTLDISASGADKKGLGAANLVMKAGLLSTPQGGTKVNISLDLQISGAAAQYGRGLVTDVTAVLVSQFAESMKNRLRAISLGLDPNDVVGAKPASGLSIGLKALYRALARVFARFFLPYVPAPRR
jgi:carbon monoxide dehydrogenase subunit G